MRGAPGHRLHDPEIVKALTALLKQYRDSGRSTPVDRAAAALRERAGDGPIDR